MSLETRECYCASAVHCGDGSDQQKGNEVKISMEKMDMLWMGIH